MATNHHTRSEPPTPDRRSGTPDRRCYEFLWWPEHRDRRREMAGPVSYAHLDVYKRQVDHQCNTLIYRRPAIIIKNLRNRRTTNGV